MRRLVPVVAGALLLSGCAAPFTDAAAPAVPSPTQAPASSSGSPTDATTRAEASAPSTQAGASRITLAFAGDVHFARQLAPLLSDSDAQWAERLPELRNADLAMVNLETAITEGGAPAAKKYTFRAPAVALDKVAAAGIDVVSMANNHAADYGRRGIEDTLDAVERSPIPVVGFGADASQAYAAKTLDVEGLRVGIIAASEVYDETYLDHSAGPDEPGIAQNVEGDRFRQAAREAVAAHDLVVAYMHWGTEGSTCPNERQVETVRTLADAGVDIVVGTHAHRPQGAGWEGRTFVGYGTGNFVWYNASPGSRSSGVLTVEVDADAVRARGADRSGGSVVRDYTWAPKVITGSGVPVEPRSSRAELERAAESARRCSGLEQQPG